MLRFFGNLAAPLTFIFDHCIAIHETREKGGIYHNMEEHSPYIACVTQCVLLPFEGGGSREGFPTRKNARTEERRRMPEMEIKSRGKWEMLLPAFKALILGGAPKSHKHPP